MHEITIRAARESRQWDDERQCYVPMAWHRCDRCNARKHGRMFEIVMNGRQMRVGLNCLVKLINELPMDGHRPAPATAQRPAPSRAIAHQDRIPTADFDDEEELYEKPGLVSRAIRWLVSK